MSTAIETPRDRFDAASTRDPQITALECENTALRRALQQHWEMNHAERCESFWPHSGRCHLPPPTLLGSELRQDALKLCQ